MIPVDSSYRYIGWLSTLLAFLFVGCSALDLSPQDPVPFETLDRGHYSSIGERGNHVFSDEESFAAFWEELHESRTPTPERPEVDFSQERVIAVTLGTRPTGGHRIEIQDISKGQVSVRTVEPGPNCVTTAALTQPYHIVKVETTPERFTFTSEHVVSDCS